MHRQQALGALVACFLIAIIYAAIALIPRFVPEPPIDPEVAIRDSLFADSLMRKWEAEHPKYEKKNKPYKKFKKPAPVPLRLQHFDPNTADSVTLLEVGLKPWQAKSLINYRDKGGRFRKTEDFRKLYGMTDSMYHALEPWIQITPQQEDSVAPVLAFPLGHEKKDTVLEINTADTSSLQFIRGIGPTKAWRIVQYRNKLGGFVRLDQLTEIDNLPLDTLYKHLTVDSTKIRPLRLNHVSFTHLTKHPYIGYERAKLLDDLRHRRTIRGENDLLKRGIFTEEEMQKLRPYLNYEK